MANQETGISLTFQGFDYLISNKLELKWLLTDMCTDKLTFYIAEEKNRFGKKDTIAFVGLESDLTVEEKKVMRMFPIFERDILGN